MDSPAPRPALLFDMDNTLFDLVGAQIASCREVALHMGREDGDALFDYFLRPAHGFESHENIHDFMRERDLLTEGTYHEACRIYEREKLRHITPYDGVEEALRELSRQGYLMGIVTDAHSRDATIRLEKVGLLPFFCCMVSCDMTGRKKPAPEPFLFALEMLRTTPRQAIAIGDSPHRDIEPCHKLGIRTVYARYGDRFSDDRRDVPADFTIDSMGELPGILSSLQNAAGPGTR